MGWFDRIFGRSGSSFNEAPATGRTDFEDNYPGKTGSGGIPGSTTTSPPQPPIPKPVRRNFQRQGDSGGTLESGTIQFQDAWQKGGVGNQYETPIAESARHDRVFDDTVVVGNLRQTWVETHIAPGYSPAAHADRWTPQATDAYLPKEGTGHPLDPAGPGFCRPVPGLPRLSEGRRKVYLTGEVQDFSPGSVAALMGFSTVRGNGRTRIRPQTWWQEPAPIFSNYYLSSPTTGTPANPVQYENAAQAQVAGHAGGRRAARAARMSGGA